MSYAFFRKYLIAFYLNFFYIPLFKPFEIFSSIPVKEFCDQIAVRAIFDPCWPCDGVGNVYVLVLNFANNQGSIYPVRIRLYPGNGLIYVRSGMESIKTSLPPAMHILKKYFTNYNLDQALIQKSDIVIDIEHSVINPSVNKISSLEGSMVGNSIGVALFTGLLSAFTGYKTDCLVASSGEVNFNHFITEILFANQKVDAAKAIGIKKIVLPSFNIVAHDESVVHIVYHNEVKEAIKEFFQAKDLKQMSKGIIKEPYYMKQDFDEATKLRIDADRAFVMNLESNNKLKDLQSIADKYYLAYKAFSNKGDNESARICLQDYIDCITTLFVNFDHSMIKYLNHFDDNIRNLEKLYFDTADICSAARVNMYAGVVYERFLNDPEYCHLSSIDRVLKFYKRALELYPESLRISQILNNRFRRINLLKAFDSCDQYNEFCFQGYEVDSKIE